MSLSPPELEWRPPVEPTPPLMPPIQPGTLCAPYDAAGARIGTWEPITVCAARCHLVVHWRPGALAGPPFAALVLWDADERWCALPMRGAAPGVDLTGEDVLLELAPLDPYREG